MSEPEKTNETIQTRCCITGGGPAGMMLGFLLARAGVDVIVLEKHKDFLRDFRGDTIHPSTMEVMRELERLLEDFLRRPHQEFTHLDAWIGATKLTIADFSHVPTRCKFLALMPQWDFLNFLEEHARGFPGFHLRMEADVTEVIRDDGRVAGIRAKTPRGTLEVRADLTVGADGRGSTVRRGAGLEVVDLGAPIDALWMRISKGPGDPEQTFGRVDAGKILVLIDRSDYWQCAYVIPKGGFDEIRRKGLPAFHNELARLAPFLGNRVEELRDWNDIKLLTVKVDHLRHWHRPGLLCIGDAAHAMSPIGGVGINLAIQDAVAAANILTEPLLHGAVRASHLRAVQRRRTWPTWATQRLQVFIQNHVINRVLRGGGIPRRKLPLALRLLRDRPVLRRIPARVIGVGFRAEHVRGSRYPALAFDSIK